MMNAEALDLVLAKLSAAALVVFTCLSAGDAVADTTFSIAKSVAQKMNPAVARGFAAYCGGDLATAEHEYAQALKTEPNNADALHGAAAVALRKDDRERAEFFYRKALGADPRDAVAQAALAGLRGQANPAATESRLKSLLAEQPEHPSLHFALGNIYATAERWSDAQQAFFNACAGDPGQPDYLFNLAVSLDHLRQDRLARTYYEKALAAARQHPAAFDPARATARLQELP
jgi:Tfp pilus assembly protein PilF